MNWCLFKRNEKPMKIKNEKWKKRKRYWWKPEEKMIEHGRKLVKEEGGDDSVNSI